MDEAHRELVLTQTRLGGARAAAVYALEWAPPAAATVGAQDGTEGASDAAQHESITRDAVAKHRPADQQPMPATYRRGRCTERNPPPSRLLVDVFYLDICCWTLPLDRCSLRGFGVGRLRVGLEGNALR